MNLLRCLLGSALAFLPLAAAAEPELRPSTMPPDAYLHVGVAGLVYQEGARMSVVGFPVPGATVQVKDVATIAAEVGYYVTPNIAASFTAGFPPLSKVTGAGTAQSLGTLGKTQGGPTGISLHYHFTQFGRIQPYVGGGLAALIVFHETDAAMQGLKVRNTLGPMLQAGVDVMLDDRWGVFVDVKKAFLTTVATGTLGGAQAKARVTLDPLVIHSGLTYRW